ncbi:MAG: thioesterase family protein [Lentisphaeria bacterium]|nr:thioesterase family protein [Candidatus Neomarinimicrobiota bacterium]MCF7843136.1 thioesterase family protein [Lentisphaeria bacterium]
MTRVKIELPEDFIFTTDIPVRITDLNYGNHLANDAILALIHEARVRFLASYGWSEKDVAGEAIIMADCAIRYRGEGFYGDVLQIEVAVTDFTRKGCDLVYRVTEKSTGRAIAEAKTGIVFYDYDQKKPVSVPEPFRQQFTD